MARGPEHGPAKKHAGGHGHEGGNKHEAHKPHAEHKPHTEHKHEAASHHGGHDEWIGKKTKEALAAGGLTAYLSTALITAAGVAMPLYLIPMLGALGIGAYAFGARGKKAGGGH